MIDDADDALCMLQVGNAPTAETFRYVDKLNGLSLNNLERV